MIPRQPKRPPFMVPNPAERFLEDEREAIAHTRPSPKHRRGANLLMRRGGSQL